MTEGKIVTWLKSPGDHVKKGESIVVVESDKADMDVESFVEGVLGSIAIPEGGTATVGEAIAYIAESEADLAEAQAKASGGASAPAEAAAPAPVIATPYAKKLAKELGVDLGAVFGSGPNGRVTAADVEAAKAAPPAPAAPAAPAPRRPRPPPPRRPRQPPRPPTETSVSDLKGTTVPLTGLQLAVSKNMLASLAIPEFRVAMSIGTGAFDALYRRLKSKGVTMTALLSKAVALALTQHPLLYAAATADGAGVTYSEHINIANAVAMPDGGLITPVLADADQRDIYSLSRDWADLVKRARAKALAPAEYSSGTFTISNLGMFGVQAFDAVLPPGTTAILAKQMVVNLTADHRVVYGAQAAEFLVTLKKVIENPDELVF
ncbi:hypothetical protein QBZ16_002128 [Prototheca wickerhamii]|uniref:Dihydrolipoamide acetyltransferase component of pyruvate dehydrogenase complex n=1 Tax=Prototheca wickerhamii TaxID=3111 RepID=A0AAD9IK13_PROWI|nr:hypothetical protein QBZ16_002128 [Prototheca wickerhamii]